MALLAACDSATSDRPRFELAHVTVKVSHADDTGVVGAQLQTGLLNFDGAATQLDGLDTWSVVDVAAGDFDGDGKLDAAAISLDGASGLLTILFGRGDGTFDRPVVVALPGEPQSLAASDSAFDGGAGLAVALAPAEGSTDPPEVLVFSRATVASLLQAAAGAGLDVSALRALLAPELSSASHGRYLLSLAAPTGGATLAGAALSTRFAVGEDATAFVVSRAGGAHAVELAGVVRVAADPFARRWRLALGPSSGGALDLFVCTPAGVAIFASAEAIGAHPAPRSVLAGGANPTGDLVADVDGDGDPDVLALDGNTGRVTSFRKSGSGPGGFAAPVDSPAGIRPIAFSRFDAGTSAASLLVANSAVINPTTATPGRLTVLGGDGKGGFAVARVLDKNPTPQSLPVADPVALAVGRFDARSTSDDILWAERTNLAQQNPGGLLLAVASQGYALIPVTPAGPDGGVDLGADLSVGDLAVADRSGLDAQIDIGNPVPDLAHDGGGPSGPLHIFTLTLAGGPSSLSSKSANDTLCTTTANTNGLAGNFVALLSYQAIGGPANYVNLGSPANIILPTGTVVSTKANFFSNSHLHAIDQGPNGVSTLVDYVFTGFGSSGLPGALHNCMYWVSGLATDTAATGSPYAINGTWAFTGVDSACNVVSEGIYCLEQ
jgi:hypothetical protein